MDNPERFVGRIIKVYGNKYTLCSYCPGTKSFLVKDNFGKSYSFEIAFVAHLLGLSYVKIDGMNDE